MQIKSEYSCPECTFAKCPKENELLAFSDFDDISRDFVDEEFITHRSPILVTKTMVDIYQRMSGSTDGSTASVMKQHLKYVLRGASGVGKSTTLLLIAHMARISNCVVLPIQGHRMREDDSPNSIARRVLRRWMYDWKP